MVRVVFFAQASAVVGSRELLWPVGEDGAGASDFWSWLEARAAGAAQLRGVCRLARNFSYLNDGERICPGDELAVLPPVSGG